MQFLDLWTTSNHQKNVLGPGNLWKSIFSVAFYRIVMSQSLKLMYFWWFSRPSYYFEARASPCTGAHESKKSKISKNGLKPTQTILEVHIKRSWVGRGTVRYHMTSWIIYFLRNQCWTSTKISMKFHYMIDRIPQKVMWWLQIVMWWLQIVTPWPYQNLDEILLYDHPWFFFKKLTSDYFFKIVTGDNNVGHSSNSVIWVELLF